MTQILVNPVKDDPIEPQGLDFVHIVPRINPMESYKQDN